MKKVLASIAAIALFSFAAHAQENRHMKQKHQHGHHGMLPKELNLSETQQKQAKGIHEEFRKKMQDLDKQESLTVKEFRDRKFALRKEQKAKMDGILTPEQKNKMAQMKVDQKKERDEHFAKHMDRMKIDLNLSEAQVKQLSAQREGVEAKMKAIKDNEALSREERKEKMMALKTEAQEQRKKIFTPDQLKKLEEMKQRKMERNAPVK